MAFLNGTDPSLRQTRTPTTQEFTGSGQSSVTLSNDPGSEDNVIITFDGVVQHRSTYSVSGTTVSFSSAVPTGVAKIEATFTTTHPAIEPADNSVTLTKLADGTQGDVLYYGASGAPTLLTAGTSGHFLKTLGSGANPAWAEAGGGKILQVVSTISGAVATGTTTMPQDDTIPQNDEGIEFMTQAITPTASGSTLEIEAYFAQVSHSVAGACIQLALFKDSDAGAIAVSAQHQITTANRSTCIGLSHSQSAGSTSAQTFKLRLGSGNSGTMTFNGRSGSREFGGKLASRIVVREIAA